MSAFEATSGLWTGLGIALVVLALFAPIVISAVVSDQPQKDCISARGDWNSDKRQCTFKENQ